MHTQHSVKPWVRLNLLSDRRHNHTREQWHGDTHTGDGQNNGNTRQYGNKTVCTGYPERTLVVSFIILCLFMLCNASINALQIVGVRLAGASVTKTPTLLGVFRAAVSKVMKVYANNGKTSSAKSNCGQKPKVSERYWRGLCLKITTLLCDNRTLTVILWTLFPQKKVQWELHKSNIHSRAAIAKPMITKNNAKKPKGWGDDHKTWISHDWKYIIWSDESPFILFPKSGLVYICIMPKEA